MKRISIVLFLLSFVLACQKNEPLHDTFSEDEITLKWNKAYDTETQESITLGVQWYLSFLGATLPTYTQHEGIKWVAEDKLILRFSKLGFNQSAINALKKIAQEVKQSEEYSMNKCVDIGRWVMLTLNSSQHYYAITGVPKTFSAFKNSYSFRDSSFVTEQSSISKNNRQVLLPSSFGIGNGAFIANEGTGSIRNGTFSKHANEVFDIMPNGQLRFAIYDELGNLQPSSDTMYSDAGKPAKCLWCHEINIQRPHGASIDVPGYYTINAFTAIVNQNMEILSRYRSKLVNGVDFSQRQAHTQAEFLYITFMEPSAERLAREWNKSVQEVTSLLANVPTHTNDEFPFLGTLYNRVDVERYAPFKGINTPENYREPALYEPNFVSE